MSDSIACVLLAAGSGSRFGGSKLLACVDGTTLIDRACTLHAKIPYAQRVLVIPLKSEVLLAQTDTEAFTQCVNPAPENGISGSVRLGLTTALQLADSSDRPLLGVLFSVCDQPYLSERTVQLLLQRFAEEPDCIVAPISEDGKRGNPVIFPRRLFSELLEISGDRGGAVVIQRHLDLLRTCPVAGRELFDVDTCSDAALANDWKH